MRSAKQRLKVRPNAGVTERNARPEEIVRNRSIDVGITDIAVVYSAHIHDKADPLVEVDGNLSTTAVRAERRHVRRRVGSGVGVTQEGFNLRCYLCRCRYREQHA